MKHTQVGALGEAALAVGGVQDLVEALVLQQRVAGVLQLVPLQRTMLQESDETCVSRCPSGRPTVLQTLE